MIIAIEGADQAGKTTQTQMLAEALERRGLGTETFAFPDYETPVGRQIKASLHLDGAAGFGQPPPQLMHILLAANRWEALPRIRAALDANDIVLMNRYYHSNLAYGMARGLTRRWLENLDAGLPKSDLVIVLDIDAVESFKRKSSGRDRFERGKGLLKEVRLRYCDEACLDKEHWKVINAIGSRQAVHARVLTAVSPAVHQLCGVWVAEPKAAALATAPVTPRQAAQNLKFARAAAALGWPPPASASS